ncbi:hypothetical protein TWF751_004088 [Orbilia oligospora]|nr:hypothetical protein TWF751_004088 [Orbilia oligospora]
MSSSAPLTDFHNFFNLYIRKKPNEIGPEQGHFTNFAFLILSSFTLSSPSHPVILCSDTPDFYELEDSPPVLKTREMSFKDAAPPAVLANAEVTPGGIRGKIANADEMRKNRSKAIRQWEEVLRSDGKEDDCRTRV